MTIYCNRCQLALISLEIDQEKAIREVYSLLENHIVKNHRETLSTFKDEIGRVGALMTSYLLVHQYALIPETEEKFLGTHNKVIEMILKLLEIDVTETLEIEKEVIGEQNV